MINKQAILDFKEVMDAMNSHPYLIGASAKNYWLYGQDADKYQATKDIDFAIKQDTQEEYLKVLTSLSNYGFEAIKSEIFTLKHTKTGDVLDVMPFGAIAPDGELTLPNGEKLVVLGFQEILPHVVSGEVLGIQVNICPPAGIILLKLLAFLDRPELRQKDLQDIRDLLKGYAFDEDPIWSNTYYDAYTSPIILSTKNADHQRILANAYAANYAIMTYLNSTISHTYRRLCDYAHQSDQLTDYWVKQFRTQDLENARTIGQNLTSILLDGFLVKA